MTDDDNDLTTNRTKTHFWLKQTKTDEDNIERWQNEQLIELRFWYMTK